MLFIQFNRRIVLARLDSISVGILMICEAVYGVKSFLPEDVMIASWIGIVFLTEVVESVIRWTEKSQTNFQESGAQKQRQQNRYQPKRMILESAGDREFLSFIFRLAW